MTSEPQVSQAEIRDWCRRAAVLLNDIDVVMDWFESGYIQCPICKEWHGGHAAHCELYALQRESKRMEMETW